MKKIFIALTVAGLAFIAKASENSDVLKKAEAGNLNALNQAFISATETDGGDAEDIDIAIGNGIRRNPKNFLAALKKNRSKVPRLDSALGNLGPEFVDDFKKQRVELEKRLAAIQSVKDATLKAVRAECETELKRQIQQRSGD